jgi:hypothetical protein
MQKVFIDELLGKIDSFTIGGTNSVVTQSDGIIVTNTEDENKKVKIVGGAIYISRPLKDDETNSQTGDGYKWTAALTCDGISASLINAGRINTEHITICNGTSPAF